MKPTATTAAAETNGFPATAKTRRELADVFGLKDADRISRYVASGMPVESDGSYSVADCLAWRDKNVKGATATPKDDAKKLLHWKAKHEKEKAKIARINRMQLESTLFDINEVYHLTQPTLVAVGELASELLEAGPAESSLTNAIMAVVNSMEPLRATLGDKVTAAAKMDKPATSATRFREIADGLGIEIPTT